MNRLDVLEAAGADGHVSEAQAKDILASYGVMTPRRVIAADRMAARAAFASLRAPVAVKLVSDAVHKSDIGGVRLGVSTYDELERAVADIERAAAVAAVAVRGFLVEEMAPPGVEVLVGGVTDPVFGPAIVLGMGGIFAEVYNDVATRFCPVDARDVDEMIREIRGAALLLGARGRPAVDIDALSRIVLAIGGAQGLLMGYAGRIREIDLNPVIVSTTGAVAVDARIILQPRCSPRTPMATDDADAIRRRFRPLFEPRAIAIVGASDNNRTRANDVLDFTLDMGFAGAVYPIHPSAETIRGLKAYRSFAECPGVVDYAFISIAAAKIPDLLASAGGRLRYAQIMASGFGETAEGKALNARLLQVARENDVRIVGPNCLGTYSPRGRIGYIHDCPTEAGAVAVVAQSGGLSTDLLRRGVQRGLRYSAVISVGNCADLGPAEFLDYFLADDDTRVIGFYLETVGDGRRFYDALRAAAAVKPVVILKGGRSRQGQRVALSHTGALAGDDRMWTALSRQTGATLVDSIDEFIAALLGFQCLSPREHRPGDSAFLVGNGGGASVLATDFMARIGMPLVAASAETRHALAALALPAGTAIDNPMDAPSGALRMQDGRIAQRLIATIARVERPDAIVFHINMPQFLTNPSIPGVVFDNLVDGALAAHADDAHASPLLLVLRSDGSAAIDDRKRSARERAVHVGVPVYDEIAEALLALLHFQRFERFRHAHAGRGGLARGD